MKIVEAYEDGEGSVDDLADRFGVHRCTVLNLLKLKRETGLLAPRPHGGGNPGKLNADDLAELRKIVEEKNDLTHPQLAEELTRRRGSDVRRSTIERALRLKLGLTRKKKR